MLELDQATLKKLQLIELEMVIEVDRICRKCDIHYNMSSGTLLGAVRHKGFIPWDDDADLAFLRPEYDKFREACKTELDTGRFYFQDHTNTEGYRWGYGKIRRKQTLFLREYQAHMPYEQGVFIDIFPIDCAPDHVIRRWLFAGHCCCIRKLLWSEVGRKADKHVYMRAWYHLLSKIPLHAIQEHYDRLQRKWNGKNTGMVRILTFPTPKTCRLGFQRQLFEHSAVFDFEGYEFQGICDYEEYLTQKFGDYRQLPPPEQRKVHPVTEIRLVDPVGLEQGRMST